VEARTGETPSALLDIPDHDEFIEPYIKAYSLLRHFADSVSNKIPFSVITEYAIALGDKCPLEFLEIMVCIERRFLTEIVAQQKRD
jgi:hypothetical protein